MNDDVKKTNLLTVFEHSDIELELEVMMPKGSNSGIYLQGRYEVQLFDSWGKKVPQDTDCGAIYHRWDAARGWTKQLHLGALRNNNARLLGKLGPDTGFDSIGDFPQAAALSRYLNTLEADPKRKNRMRRRTLCQ